MFLPMRTCGWSGSDTRHYMPHRLFVESGRICLIFPAIRLDLELSADNLAVEEGFADNPAITPQNMKAYTPLITLVSFFALLLTARASSFEEWRALHFSPAQLADPLVSGPDANPDGDQLRNFAEYVLGTDPWLLPAEPIVAPAISLDPTDGLLHLNATLIVSSPESQGALLLPQVTEDLDARWRADQAALQIAGVLPDGRFQLTAWDLVPANLPEHRFIRLMIAADADADGMPDDWETSIGLSPVDPYDSMWDADGDGDSNLNEFLHGTDPLNASDNMRRDQIPRAPRNASIINNPDDTREVVWEDVSNNEQFFAIFTTDANGVEVEVGRVASNGARFGPLGTATPVSVRSGNETGMSEAAAAADPGQANGFEFNGHAVKKFLTKPEITELRRLDLNRVICLSR